MTIFGQRLEALQWNVRCTARRGRVRCLKTRQDEVTRAVTIAMRAGARSRRTLSFSHSWMQIIEAAVQVDFAEVLDGKECRTDECQEIDAPDRARRDIKRVTARSRSPPEKA
ncbi:unnamed protein product [Cercospora beticola]|nr:unnamed protein product [Cercospora beticola]